jgi:hypothetical protein
VAPWTGSGGPYHHPVGLGAGFGLIPLPAGVGGSASHPAPCQDCDAELLWSVAFAAARPRHDPVGDPAHGRSGRHRRGSRGGVASGRTTLASTTPASRTAMSPPPAARQAMRRRRPRRATASTSPGPHQPRPSGVDDRDDPPGQDRTLRDPSLLAGSATSRSTASLARPLASRVFTVAAGIPRQAATLSTERSRQWCSTSTSR